MVKHWNKLPKVVVDVPSLKTFKVSLDRARSNLLSLKMSMLIAGRLDWMAFKGHAIQISLCLFLVILYFLLEDSFIRTPSLCLYVMHPTHCSTPWIIIAMAKIWTCSSNPYQTQSLPPDLQLPWAVHGTEAINVLDESESKSERMIFKCKSNALRFTAIEILYMLHLYLFSRAHSDISIWEFLI